MPKLNIKTALYLNTKYMYISCFKDPMTKLSLWVMWVACGIEVGPSGLNSNQPWWTWPSLVCGPRTPVNSGPCGEEPSISLGVDSSSSSSSASSGGGGGVRSSLLPEGITVAISIWKRNRISSGNLLNHPSYEAGTQILKVSILATRGRWCSEVQHCRARLPGWAHGVRYCYCCF